MASFVFVVDLEEGHLFPTFGLSKSLKTRGHVVHYVSILDNKRFVVEQGFEFHSVLEQQYPLGSKQEFKKTHLNKGVYPRFSLINSIEKELKIIFEVIKPHGVIVNTFLSLEALLIYYRYSIKPIIFTPYLVSHSTPPRECENEFRSLKKNMRYKIFQSYRNYNDSLKNKKLPLIKNLISKIKKSIDQADLQKFISPLEYFEEIVACPQQFDFPATALRNNVHYIGPCIRDKTPDDQSLFHVKSKDKKIVYVTLGSQTERIHKVCETFFLKIIDLMKDPEMADFHIVLSAGSAFKLKDIESMPTNITTCEWVDTLKVLEISFATITHGGLGLIKESIFYGVPMIVLPDKYDQPMNAQRVEYHKLGIQDNLVTVTKERLKSHLRKIDTDQTIKEKVKQMKDIFREKEELEEGAMLIERICNTQITLS